MWFCSRRCSAGVYAISGALRSNPEPGGDPASVTLYGSDRDGNAYPSARWCELCSGDVEGVDVATIGMVDPAVDGVVLFPLSAGT